MVHGKYFSQNRDFFFSWMINEYNEQKKPVASSRTFRLWMAQATCVGEFTTKSWVSLLQKGTLLQVISLWQDIWKWSTPREERREATPNPGKKDEASLRGSQLGRSSRRGAGSSGSLQLTGERKRASRGLERGREGWAMARQKPWGSPTVFYIINVSLRVLCDCIADWTRMGSDVYILQ